ncbi:MAG: DUF378 domain-containing protein [Candidatus Paracaedibacteraceae bacterium]|nr:DUF378 domain-containing protein [Candidatus Paracaedibacteraceae bacterium]
MLNITTLRTICLSLSIIGAFNWGLVGLTNFNLVTYFLSENSLSCRFIYLIIGFSGLFLAASCFFRDMKN